MRDAAGDDGGLPPGWGIKLSPEARRIEAGRVLIGGSPLRILRLTAAGYRWLDDLAAGQPLSPPAKPRILARRLVEAGLADPLPPPDTRATPRDVAVVVPVRDDAPGLVKTLAGIGAVGEVVVVDDASREPAAVELDETVATILRNEHPVGPGGARERGWRSTSRPFIAFVDANVEAQGTWLAPLLTQLSDPSVGAVAPRVVAHPGRAPRTLARYEATRSPLDLGRNAREVRSHSPLPYVPTATLLVRREALEAVAGFDVDLRVGEDVDLVWRLEAHGWRVRYEPGATVSHPTRASYTLWMRQRVTYGTSAAPLRRRHGARCAPLEISFSNLAPWLALLAGRPVLAAGLGATSVLTLSRRLTGVDHPTRHAAEIVGQGHLQAGRAFADALRRPWWPLAAALALRWPQARPTLLAALILPPLLDRIDAPPQLDPVRYAVLRLVDDLAYGTGVWIGCVRERSGRALLPKLSGLRTRGDRGQRLASEPTG